MYSRTIEWIDLQHQNASFTEIEIDNCIKPWWLNPLILHSKSKDDTHKLIFFGGQKDNDKAVKVV